MSHRLIHGTAEWDITTPLHGHLPPANIKLLAVGGQGGGLVNGVPWYEGSQMTYYDHPGGGFVFSASSIAFCGSLFVDPNLQRIVLNCLTKALGE